MSSKKITNFFKTTSTSVSATASTASDSLKRKHELETEDSQIIGGKVINNNFKIFDLKLVGIRHIKVLIIWPLHAIKLHYSLAWSIIHMCIKCMAV